MYVCVSRFCKSTGAQNTLKALCEFVSGGGDLQGKLLRYCETPDQVRDEVSEAMAALSAPNNAVEESNGIVI